MSITFGVGTLKVLENRPVDIVIGDLSASAATLTAGADRSVMIDGITATVSAQVVSLTALMGTGLGATASNNLLYAYIAAGDTTTATLAMANNSAVVNTSTNVPTAIAPIANFAFGTGANNISTIVLVSGGSATKTIAKVQNVSINISYENAQMRGGGDVFPVDTKFFDGSVEGSFDFGDNTATQLLFFGGTYSSGGSSGTWTLSGTSKPNPVSLVFQNVTDGITGTYRIMKAYLTQQTNDFSRTEFMQPSYTFMTQSNNQGTTLTVTK